MCFDALRWALMGSDGLGSIGSEVARLMWIPSGCQTLTLLRGTTVEGWDLVAGSILGCWALGGGSMTQA